MANLGLVTLGSLRLQAQQKADMVNSQFLTTPEWNINITNSRKELYDLLISAYGNQYSVAAPYAFTTTGNTNLYALPDGLTTVDAVTGLTAAPFYKLIGVDLRTVANPNQWITLKRFEFTERNKYSVSNQYSYYGITTLQYQIVGSNLWLTPVPVSGQTLQMWYIPEPSNLQATIIGAITSSSAVITTPDTSQLSVGMTVYGTNIPTNATISSIVTNTSITISSACQTTASNQLISAWIDTTTVDGISGWEEYIILDAAIKARIKEESDIQALMIQKASMLDRINQLSESRDASLPSRVSDTQSIDYSYMPGGAFGYGEWM